MVAIAPFRALRFRNGLDLAALTTPPHDCIPEPLLRHFRAGDPRNVVHVVLPEDASSDGPEAKFQRAAALLAKLMADGDLARDARPAFYLYHATHGPAESRATMRALFCRLRLDPAHKEVKPHEKTLRRAKQDRLHLRVATRCDVEPIWLLYRDPRGWVEELLESNSFDELARFTDEEGTEHRLWRVDRPEAVGEIVAQFEDRTLVIADGHHRYQTALDHHAQTGRPEHGSILVGLVRDNDPGLRIEATHRLVHSTGMTLAQALAKATHHTVRRIHSDDLLADAHDLAAMPGAEGRQAVVVGKGADGRLEAHLLTLKPGSELATGRGRLDTLAVTRVHERLLRDGWGFDLEKPEAHLRFSRDPHAALQEVAHGGCEFALLLSPEPVAAVLDVASEGQLMPQKATYFVPKLRSGVVLSPLDEPLPVGWTEVAGDGGRPDTRLPKI
ncbi:MAG: hypothetical protein QOD77_1385 [Thermoplasmata archaeon]|jgi:uncharacterized protein (DUF1015 family)|nr:hypothetical protein [Thermoplasmata archaeon]